MSESVQRPLLAIDASCEYLGLALAGPDGRRSVLSFESGLKHGESLFPRIQELLAGLGLQAADLGAVVCSRGPGSFTGLRIGLAAAKGLSAGLDIPVLGVSSLDAMARCFAHWPGLCLCLLDARKQRFYGSLYRQGQAVADHQDRELAEYLQQAGRLAASGPATALPLLVATPHLGVVQAELARLGQTTGGTAGLEPWLAPAQASCFWMDALLDLGWEMLVHGRTSADDEGPEYLRHSHEDLGIHLAPPRPAGPDKPRA